VADLLAQEIPEVDLRAVGVGGRAGSGVLTVVIDHPERVDHALCARVTRVLDDAGLRDRYAVEVSSPGPEPPLRTTRHYLAAVGETVKLAVEPGTVPDAAKSVSGTLISVGDDDLTVDTPAGQVVVPRDAVRRARMVKRSN
jgi:ribosome maturation factor RimP